MIKILFLAANPKDTDPLRLGEEVREIEERLRLAELRDEFEVKSKWAVRVTDLASYLLQYKPDVVHFSGHGSRGGELILEDEHGTSHPVSPEALRDLFATLRDNVRCVLLNACYSEGQANGIAESVGCVVGMSGPIHDDSAIRFAAGFYEGLGYGRSVKTAFDLGCWRVKHAGGSQSVRDLVGEKAALPTQIPPKLKETPGVDPAKLVLATARPAPPSTSPGLEPLWFVPHRQNPFFTGREEVVAELRRRLTGTGKTVLAQAISGLGGIGKTQTAVEYAFRFRDEYQAVLWLNAESPLDLKLGCGELARAMHLPHQEDDLDRAVQALRLWLSAHPGWLLIFDNADDPAILEPLLPDAKHGHFLITSRARDFQCLGIVDPVELAELPVKDATEFLLRRCNRQAADAEERDAAERLARELGGLPLALEQAAAYMVERKATFDQYLQGLSTRGVTLLAALPPALGRYHMSVITTWAANYEAVQDESPAAAEVLRFSAFLAPDAIPFELLVQGASELGPLVQDALSGADRDPLLVHDLLQPLCRYSLIRIDGDTELYGTHRMVQEVLKDAIDDATRRLWSERAVRAVNQAFPVVEFGNWSRINRLLTHALVVASLVERDGMKFDEAGRILNQVAHYLHDRGQYAEAEPLCRQAMEIHRTALGEGHPDFAISVNNLAALYRAMGRHAEAEPLYRQAADTIRTAFGEGHPYFANSLNNLAELYCSMGRHAEAEPLCRQAMEIRRTALGEGHPEFATSLLLLASLYRAMGRHAEAEPLCRQAMDTFRTALGEKHPYFAASVNNLAGLYNAMGRHAEADSLIGQNATASDITSGRTIRFFRWLKSMLRRLLDSLWHHKGDIAIHGGSGR
jgi:tetratricopeptide (TPR) repeat protein